MQYRLFCTALVLLAASLVACVPYKEGRSASDTAEYHYMMGVTAMDEQNPTAALKELLMAEEFDSRDAKIQSALARVYWLKQAHDLAMHSDGYWVFTQKHDLLMTASIGSYFQVGNRRIADAAPTSDEAPESVPP